MNGSAIFLALIVKKLRYCNLKLRVYVISRRGPELGR
jgi:hypothetical protein